MLAWLDENASPKKCHIESSINNRIIREKTAKEHKETSRSVLLVPRYKYNIGKLCFLTRSIQHKNIFPKKKKKKKKKSA